MKADSKSKLGRRNFLQALGAGVVLGAGASTCHPSCRGHRD